ncbi:hypothetical protein QLG25_18745 [Pseudomonas sp. CBR-F]
MKLPKKYRLGFVSFLISNKRWFAFASLIVILVMVAAAIAAPLLFDWDSVTKINLSTSLVEPGASSWLGTDQLGRDLLGRVVWGHELRSPSQFQVSALRWSLASL